MHLCTNFCCTSGLASLHEPSCRVAALPLHCCSASALRRLYQSESKNSHGLCGSLNCFGAVLDSVMTVIENKYRRSLASSREGDVHQLRSRKSQLARKLEHNNATWRSSMGKCRWPRRKGHRWSDSLRDSRCPPAARPRHTRALDRCGGLHRKKKKLSDD